MKLVKNMWLTPGRVVAMREGGMVWQGSITSPTLRDIVCDELLLSPADYDAMAKDVDQGLTRIRDARIRRPNAVLIRYL